MRESRIVMLLILAANLFAPVMLLLVFIALSTV